MSKLNKDGLEPGQIVDFDTIMRINKDRKQKVSKNDKPKQSKVRAAGIDRISGLQEADGEKAES